MCLLTCSQDIASGKFQQVIVSPEIVKSNEFRRAVLSKSSFSSRLRAVCIDEAHCVSLWGGSFRPEYGELGALRARFPSNVPFLIASATLPDHVIDDIRGKLGISKDATTIAISNDRPNVSLSCRQMRHSEESHGDLRFLIPPGASKADDIDITLVYCNTRTTCEDICDNLRRWAVHESIEDPEVWIAFYHAKVGAKRKRELEEKLRNGTIRILICTDAVGMVSTDRLRSSLTPRLTSILAQGCDMRNIKRVVMWGLPPSFCALVQRAGRAGRDFNTLGEAILIVSAATIKKGITEAETEAAIAEAAEEAAREMDEDSQQLENDERGVEITNGNEEVLVNEGGIRASRDDDDDGEDASTENTKKKRKKAAQGYNAREARYLSWYCSGLRCLREIWSEFFNNKNKS